MYAYKIADQFGKEWVVAAETFAEAVAKASTGYAEYGPMSGDYDVEVRHCERIGTMLFENISQD